MVSRNKRANIVTQPLRTSIGRYLLYTVTFEAALLGSGRMLEIGPVTVKMLLYALTLLYTAWSLLALESLRRSTLLLLASFGALLSFGIANRGWLLR